MCGKCISAGANESHVLLAAKEAAWMRDSVQVEARGSDYRDWIRRCGCADADERAMNYGQRDRRKTDRLDVLFHIVRHASDHTEAAAILRRVAAEIG
jgi:hypothetical protein